MERLRLFIAVDINGDVADRCESVVQELKRLDRRSLVNWVAPSKMHLTLKFLGSTSSVDIPIIEGALNKLASVHRSFPISVKGIGTFPPTGAVQIIWAGIQDGKTEIARIAADIDRTLGELGFPRERKNFAAHLTLGRIKKGGFRRGALKDIENTYFGSAFVSELVLFESRTLPTGAVYRPISRARLTA